MEEKEKTTLEESLPESEELDDSELSRLYEESLKDIQEGEVINGKVIKIDQDMVTVDVGYKSEGQIALAEFLDESGELNIKVGDTVGVFLERVEDEEGQVILSKEKADKITIWDEVSDVFEQNGVIEGKIIDKTKGGMSVDIGLKAFLPGSQIDLRPVRNL
ncbi:MAG: S1 RNA-binding domain-containing protein, partial [Thermodesulfobacteriota bacterium]